MSQIRYRNPTHDPYKSSLKPSISHTSTDCCKKLLKGAVWVALVASLSIGLYSAFTSPKGWLLCPHYHDPTQNSAETHNVPVQNAGPTNISHIVFGLGGSAKMWAQRRNYVQLWWKPDVTRGYVWLDERPDPNTTWSEMSPPYRVSENLTRFRDTKFPFVVRISRIISESFRLGLPDVRWFVVGDDDTVFFLDNLVSVLSKYDHRSMYYVGGNSESVASDVRFSYEMAYGGGGYAISYPLAAELVKVLDGCTDRYNKLFLADEKVWACLHEIGVSLTKVPGFHQLDIKGDAYGLLAAHPVAPLVSLHHIDLVNPLFPGQTRIESLQTLFQAYRVDPVQALQQSFCHDRKRKWSVSIAWGYTAQIYPSLLAAKDLATHLLTFRTLKNRDGPFTFNTRPMMSDPCGQPFIYFLDNAVEVDHGQTLTTYKVNMGKPQKKCVSPITTVQTVVVLASKMDPRELLEGPRRRCCEIEESLDANTLRVRIRRCERGETVTS